MFDQSKYIKNYYAERRRQRKAEHRCTYCGEKLKEECKTLLCDACRDKYNERTKKYRDRKHLESDSHKDTHAYNKSEADICLTCTAKTCNGNCRRFSREKEKLEMSEGK